MVTYDSNYIALLHDIADIISIRLREQHLLSIHCGEQYLSNSVPKCRTRCNDKNYVYFSFQNTQQASTNVISWFPMCGMRCNDINYVYFERRNIHNLCHYNAFHTLGQNWINIAHHSLWLVNVVHAV